MFTSMTEKCVVPTEKHSVSQSKRTHSIGHNHRNQQKSRQDSASSLSAPPTAILQCRIDIRFTCAEERLTRGTGLRKANTMLRGRGPGTSCTFLVCVFEHIDLAALLHLRQRLLLCEATDLSYWYIHE